MAAPAAAAAAAPAAAHVAGSKRSHEEMGTCAEEGAAAAKKAIREDHHNATHGQDTVMDTTTFRPANLCDLKFVCFGHTFHIHRFLVARRSRWFAERIQEQLEAHKEEERKAGTLLPVDLTIIMADGTGPFSCLEEAQTFMTSLYRGKAEQKGRESKQDARVKHLHMLNFFVCEKEFDRVAEITRKFFVVDHPEVRPFRHCLTIQQCWELAGNYHWPWLKEKVAAAVLKNDEDAALIKDPALSHQLLPLIRAIAAPKVQKKKKITCTCSVCSRSEQEAAAAESSESSDSDVDVTD
jgi:hypothetical protein